MLTLSVANQVAHAIVKHQTEIIGPLAYEQARKVPGIIVSTSGVEIKDPSNPDDIINQLVLRYEELFGQTSVEVCRDAIRELGTSISRKDLPSILQ